MNKNVKLLEKERWVRGRVEEKELRNPLAWSLTNVSQKEIPSDKEDDGNCGNFKLFALQECLCLTAPCIHRSSDR